VIFSSKTLVTQKTNKILEMLEVFCWYRADVIGEPKSKGTEEEVIRWNFQRGINFPRREKSRII